ncbi:MAG: hypothetical protein Kilf2KO_38800 [Rhodospirillales bacterium]
MPQVPSAKTKTLHAVVALSFLAAASAAAGEETSNEVRCYGIAKAGENDCVSAAGSHDCAGKARMDYAGSDWKKLESETACQDMGGSLQPFLGTKGKPDRD